MQCGADYRASPFTLLLCSTSARRGACDHEPARDENLNGARRELNVNVNIVHMNMKGEHQRVREVATLGFRKTMESANQSWRLDAEAACIG